MKTVEYAPVTGDGRLDARDDQGLAPPSCGSNVYWLRGYDAKRLLSSQAPRDGDCFWERDPKLRMVKHFLFTNKTIQT